MAQLDFNPDEIVDDEERDLPSVGWHVAQIIESEHRPTKDGAEFLQSVGRTLASLENEEFIDYRERGYGTFLALTWEIMEGACAKRRVWDRINLFNKNAQAQEIGQRELKRLSTAMGLSGKLDSDDFCFKPHRIRIAHEDDKSGRYPTKAVVKGFEPFKNATPANFSQRRTDPPAQSSAPPQQQRAAAGGGSRPWGNR